MSTQVLLPRSAIEKCVRSYKRVKASYFVLTKELKPKQLSNAIKRIAPEVREEDVVALMDTTVFSSGKEGFLLTSTHMYTKCMESHKIDLNRLSKLNRKDSYLTVGYPDGKSETVYVSIFDQDLFNILKLIMEESEKAEAEVAQKQQKAEAAQKRLEQDLLGMLKDMVPEPKVPEVISEAVPEPKPDSKPEPKSEPEDDEPRITPTPAFDPIDEPDEEPQPEPPAAPGADAEAEALFQEGQKKFMAKDYSAAVAAFKKAADLGHKKAAQFLAQLKGIIGGKT